MDKNKIEDLVNQLVNQKIAKYEEQEKKLKSQKASGQSKDINTLVKLVRNVPLPSGLKLEGNVRENIEYFKKMWKNYETASGLYAEENSVRVSTMLTAIGDEASKRIYSIVEAPETMKTEEILDILTKKLAPEINIRYERYIYNSMKQSDNDSYQEYFLKLKKQSKLCDYKNMEEELMLDKIICSIKDVKLREKLWLKKDINLTEALDMCRSSEETKRQLEVIEEK